MRGQTLISFQPTLGRKILWQFQTKTSMPAKKARSFDFTRSLRTCWSRLAQPAAKNVLSRGGDSQRSQFNKQRSAYRMISKPGSHRSARKKVTVPDEAKGCCCVENASKVIWKTGVRFPTAQRNRFFLAFRKVTANSMKIHGKVESNHSDWLGGDCPSKLEKKKHTADSPKLRSSFLEKRVISLKKSANEI